MTERVTIDGRTAPAYAFADPDARPVVHLDGASAGAAVTALIVAMGADRTELHALAIHGFSGDGISIAAREVVVEGCHVGLRDGAVVDGLGGGAIELVVPGRAHRGALRAGARIRRAWQRARGQQRRDRRAGSRPPHRRPPHRRRSRGHRLLPGRRADRAHRLGRPPDRLGHRPRERAGPRRHDGRRPGARRGQRDLGQRRLRGPPHGAGSCRGGQPDRHQQLDRHRSGGPRPRQQGRRHLARHSQHGRRRGAGRRQRDRLQPRRHPRDRKPECDRRQLHRHRRDGGRSRQRRRRHRGPRPRADERGVGGQRGRFGAHHTRRGRPRPRQHHRVQRRGGHRRHIARPGRDRAGPGDRAAGAAGAQRNVRSNSASIAAAPDSERKRVPVPQKCGWRITGSGAGSKSSPVQRNHSFRSWS